MKIPPRVYGAIETMKTIAAGERVYTSFLPGLTVKWLVELGYLEARQPKAFKTTNEKSMRFGNHNNGQHYFRTSLMDHSEVSR